MSRKVFTAGEVLAAADVNNFLMNQTVMSFAGTASRAASIPTPVEGMYTHLEDSDRLEFWNGSAWATPFGLTLINRTTFTSQASISVSDVFSTTYDNYLITVNMLQATIANNEVRLRLRTSSGDDTSAIYNGSYNCLDNGGGVTLRNGGYNQTQAFLTTNAYDTVPIRFSLFLNGPINARKSLSGLVNAGNLAAAGFGTTGCSVESATTHTGFTIYSSAGTTYTGSITVYGLRK
jgi:hypothetical protein